MFSGIFGTKSNSTTSKSGNAPSPSASFGANIPVGNKALSAEISEAGQKFVKANKKYRDEIDKYKKIAEFNKKLSTSYIENVHAMIDVSKLLNDYALFFNLLKEEIAKTEGQIGTLQASDIAYLENLTKSKMEEFSNRFIEESNKVKALYDKYGQDAEAKTISTAQEDIKGIVGNATTTYSDIVELTRPTQGGRSRKVSTSTRAAASKSRTTSRSKSSHSKSTRATKRT
jgi:hypothetical protein